MSHESVIPVQKIRHSYSGGNVTTAAWTEISSSANTKRGRVVEIFDSSGQTLVLGYGASGSEAEFPFYILPGGNGRISLQIDAGQRLAVKAISANATSGELVLNIFQ